MRRTPLVISDPAHMAARAENERAAGHRLVLVPTMGALHEGHLALLREALRRGDRLVLSIFVNPTQFARGEDYARYPRRVGEDLEQAAAEGVDLAFVPEVDAMYGPHHQTSVDVRGVSEGLCGAHRLGHFAGVATVVLKLFNIVRPHVAVFGEKDYQQLIVIRQMVGDLNVPVEVVGHPTVREPDGLAMSSRNAYLDDVERQRALTLSRGLFAAAAASRDGERDPVALVKIVRDTVTPALDTVEYVEIRDASTLAPVGDLARPAVLLVAGWVGKTRLIDNIKLA